MEMCVCGHSRDNHYLSPNLWVGHIVCNYGYCPCINFEVIGKRPPIYKDRIDKLKAQLELNNG